jgi:hypothetical protein
MGSHQWLDDLFQLLPSRRYSLHSAIYRPPWGGFSSAVVELYRPYRLGGSSARQVDVWMCGCVKGASALVRCHRSSVVEHTLGKGEVTGSSPVGGFKNFGNDHVFHMVRSQPEPD